MVLHPNEFLDGSREEDVCEPKKPPGHFLPWALTSSHWFVPESKYGVRNSEDTFGKSKRNENSGKDFFDTLPIIVQWTWSEDLVTTSFLLKWMLLTFLLSVWKTGIPFPWWGILAPLCSVQPEFRGGELHPCRGARKDAQVQFTVLSFLTPPSTSLGKNRMAGGEEGKQIFGLFFFFSLVVMLLS